MLVKYTRCHCVDAEGAALGDAGRRPLVMFCDYAVNVEASMTNRKRTSETSTRSHASLI